MRKIFSLVLCGIVLLGMTGCGDDSSNNKKENKNEGKSNSEVIKDTVEKEISLECSGDYLFNFGFMVRKGAITKEEDNSDKIDGYYFDDGSGIGNGEYRFVFDGEKITKMSSVETMNLTYSKQITDSMLKEEDESMESCTIVRNSNGNVVIKCEFDNEDDYVKALNLDVKTPDDLKSILEKNTDLVCK